MASEPQRNPGAPGASSEPVQRKLAGTGVPLHWLQEPDQAELGRVPQVIRGGVR